MESPTPKTKLIIDTDAGVDDTYGLMLALLHPDFEVIAITCLTGNVHVNEVVKNVALTLSTANKVHVPIYRGAHDSINGKWREGGTWEGHGVDGMGNCGVKEQLVKVQEIHAVRALQELMAPDVHLMCLGPLTNIALAILMDESFAQKISPKYFTIMGGAYLSKGNITCSSEFNIHFDPEAAAICFNKISRINLISWECTVEHSLGWNFYDEVIATNDTNPVIILLRRITQNFEKIERPASPFNMCDLLAVAVGMCPELVTEAIEMAGHIELTGTYTRGSTVFDWSGFNSKGPKNINVILKVDVEKYKELCKKTWEGFQKD